MRRNITGGLIAAGLISRVIIIYITRTKKNEKRILVDERDREISRRAAEGSFHTLAIFVFFACIILHDNFLSEGSIPVEWMFLLAFATLILAHLTQSTISLLFYHRRDESSG
ncbi:MAG: DUF2178 domain-containing protein [Bacteroidales bacterium]|nr:DUF2178 domain-containing protein [Candidatus Latescibacterota bacterium]